jgi:hypothetical protein
MKPGCSAGVLVCPNFVALEEFDHAIRFGHLGGERVCSLCQIGNALGGACVAGEDNDPARRLEPVGVRFVLAVRRAFLREMETTSL